MGKNHWRSVFSWVGLHRTYPRLGNSIYTIFSERQPYFPILGHKNPLLQAIAFFDFDEVIIFAFETPS